MKLDAQVGISGTPLSRTNESVMTECRRVGTFGGGWYVETLAHGQRTRARLVNTTANAGVVNPVFRPATAEMPFLKQLWVPPRPGERSP
ncbi:hypothetical protein [Prauserella muralis]|uniref:hypothetical protein n=1 Tax=Prauserella muralis TaxID=588067 RepID=UPI0011ABD6A7|nr:hypothetical protein [Prauserella muralis]TWE23737.1 hypothetical protein FHX69_5034 [Prauserella muralis]